MKAKYSLHLRKLRLPINYEKRKTIDTSLTGNSYTDKSFFLWCRPLAGILSGDGTRYLDRQCDASGVSVV